MQQLATEYINGSVSIGGLKWEGGRADGRCRKGCQGREGSGASAHCYYHAAMAGNAEGRACAEQD